MYLSVQRSVDPKPFKGNYKIVEQTETKWHMNGIEHIKYGFLQSGGRFERENIAYHFEVMDSDSDEENRQLHLGTVDWYAMNSPGEIYQELLGKPKIDDIKDMFCPDGKELEALIISINAEIDKCIQFFTELYHSSQEYAISKQNQKRIERWLKAKIRFEKEYGTDHFEEIYNFDLELMNFDLLEQVRSRKKQKESYRPQNESSGDQSKDSEDNEEKDDRTSSSNYDNYSDEERNYLKKFYKTLAKNYHPDVSHDDGKAMQFLNKLRDHWNI